MVPANGYREEHLLHERVPKTSRRWLFLRFYLLFNCFFGGWEYGEKAKHLLLLLDCGSVLLSWHIHCASTKQCKKEKWVLAGKACWVVTSPEDFKVMQFTDCILQIVAQVSLLRPATEQHMVWLTSLQWMQ